MKAKTALLTLATLFALTACGGPPSAEEQAKEDKKQKLQTEGEVSVIGTFDGCEVKYVNRYYRDNSFYLARCSVPDGAASAPTSTVTHHYDERVGKTNQLRTRVEITQEIAKLQEEAKAAEVRESALAKLSAEERKALGLAGK
jgi:predicted small lipoprotein YifL